MRFNKENINDIKELIFMMEKFVSYMKDESKCKGILKSINSLKNRDPMGTKAIKKNIYNDFRMILERGEYRGDVQEMCDSIDELLERIPFG